MTGNTVRTIVVFSIIGIIFAGVTVGGIRLLKARNDAYASRQQQAPQKPQERQPEEQPKQEVKTEDSKQNQTAASNNSAPQQSQPSSTPQPAQTSPNATPEPAKQPTNNQAAVTGPTELATTGPSSGDFVFSMLLVMLAIFFGIKVLQARTLVRRHLS